MRKTILIPSTFTGEKKDRKIRIFLISQLARTIANFGINEIGIYYDDDPRFNSHGLGRFLLKVLKYLNTPPYIRKIAFPIEKELEEIGAALPLNTYYHKERDRYEYVYILERKKDDFLVTNGEKKFYVNVKRKFRNTRILIYDKLKNELLYPYETEYYFGYEVFYFNKPLEELLKKLKNEGFYLIGTSRYGDDIRKVKIEKKDKVAIVFGSFARGIEDIINNWKEKFDITINICPDQKLETIRTEEAIDYTLSILHYLNII
jgi:predicted SPOUT superfamily RNA methylase MTH1